MSQDTKKNSEAQETPLTLLLKSPQKLAQPTRSQTPLGLPQSGIAAVSPNTLSIETKPIITLQNVVATVNLDSELDLRKINFCTRNAEYNPGRFKGLVMRIREPKTTALIFRSGKVVVTGAKSEAAAFLAARKYARIIQKLGFPVKFFDFKVQNIVGTCDVRFPIKLESLNQSHGQFSRYEPELFPALVYRLVNPRVVLLIFVNGKVVLTGARTKQEIQKALDSMLPTLRSFRKQKRKMPKTRMCNEKEDITRRFLPFNRRIRVTLQRNKVMLHSHYPQQIMFRLNFHFFLISADCISEKLRNALNLYCGECELKVFSQLK